jgi:hypothetical protein
MGNSAGTHSFLGVIKLRKDQADLVGNGFGFVEVGKLGKTQTGLHTLIHELVHGADRMSVLAFKDAGKVVAETTTEIASRRIVLDLSGATKESVLVTEKYFSESYKKEISDLLKVVEDTTEWSKEQTLEAVTKASVLIHTKAVKVATTPEQMVDNFVSCLPGSGELAAEQKRNLRFGILDLRMKHR